MKKFLIIIASIAAVVGGYFLYSFLMKKSTAELWTLIPDDTFAVIEVRNAGEQWSNYENTKLRSFLANCNDYKSMHNKLAYLSKSLENGGIYSLLDVVGDKTLLFSFHLQKETGMEAVFYLPLTKNDALFSKEVKEIITSNPNFMWKESVNEGKKYNEIHFLETNEVLYFQEFHGVFIASFSKNSFFKTLKKKLDVNNLAKSRISKLKLHHEKSETETEDINIFVDYTAITNVFKTYLNESTVPLVEELSRFATYSFLGMGLTEDVVTWSGFTTCSDSSVSYLSVFDDQTSRKHNWVKYIPQNVVTVNTFYIDNVLSYYNKIKSYSWQADEEHSNEYDEILEMLSGDVMHLNMLSASGEVDKIAIYKVKNTETALRWIKEQALDQHEEFSDVQIGLLNKSNILSSLHGGMYANVKANAFTVLDDYLVFAPSIPAMKEYILHTKSGKNWANSLVDKHNFEDHFLESNFSYYINPFLVIKAIYDNLSESGATLRNQLSKGIGGVEFLMLEYSNQGEKYYTDVVLKFSEQEKVFTENDKLNEEPTEQTVKTIFEYVHNIPIISKAHVVKNYLHRTREVILQDSMYALLMIDHEGKKRWTYPLEDEVLGNVFEVDIFNNQKIQYLFTTKKKVYALDRKGSLVEHFPFSLPDNKQIDAVSVVDYSNDKNYRILLTSGSEVYMYDVKGANLEGWNPKQFETNVVGAVEHVRVRDKDYLIAFLENGKIDVVNRRAEQEKGFTANLGAKLKSNGFVKAGNSNAKTYFYTVTDDNKIKTTNLNAKIVAETSLLGINNTSIMASEEDIVIVSKNDSCVYFQHVLTGTSVKIAVAYSDKVLCQFYGISGKKHYVITDVTARKTMVYGANGKLINQADLENNKEVALLYSSTKNLYHIYLVEKNKLKLVEF